MRHFFVLLAALAAFAADAADIGVLPVGVSLSARQDRQAVTVTNHGSTAALMQAEAMAWSQNGGKDDYRPTRDLLVNPPLFTVPPGGSQIVRIGLRRPVDPARELAYRLFLREVPLQAPMAPEAAGQQQIRVLMELRLPVYVAPPNPLPAQQWRARRQPDGSLALEVENTGNVHYVVAGIKLRNAGAAPDSAPLADVRNSGTVLPGQVQRWVVRPTGGIAGAGLALEVATDRGAQHVAVDLGRN